jgi:putative ABC transport system ATP-binding protein
MVEVSHVRRTYGSGRTAVHALHDVSFEVGAGELVALVGRSGSGKTTLLNVVGGLDRPDDGRVLLDGVDVASLDEAGLDRLHRDVVAFVFQSFGLVGELTAAENVGLPLRLRRLPVADRERRVAQLLELVGLGEHAEHRPDEMSGGQMQRVAIARALAGSPRVLVADEPTGQLDTETGLAVMALIRGVVEAEGTAAVVATHDPVMMALADRVVHLVDGRLVEEDPAVHGPASGGSADAGATADVTAADGRPTGEA